MPSYDAYIRDNSIWARLDWLTHDIPEVEKTAREYEYAESRREKRRKLEELIVAILIALLRSGMRIEDAIRSTIETLYKIELPPIDLPALVVSIFNEHREQIIEAAQERNRIDSAVVLASSSANSKLMRDLMAGMGLMAATLIGQSMKSSAMEAFMMAAQDVSQTIEEATRLEKPVDLGRVLKSASGKRIMYRYIHTLHLEGICSQCIVYVGKITIGDGSDGIPKPPLHPHCKCALVPVVLDEAEIDEEQMNPIENLSKVPRDKLSHVIGPVRARLIMEDRLTLHSLFTDDMSRMKTLEELGLDRNGKALKP